MSARRSVSGNFFTVNFKCIQIGREMRQHCLSDGLVACWLVIVKVVWPPFWVLVVTPRNRIGRLVIKPREPCGLIDAHKSSPRGIVRDQLRDAQEIRMNACPHGYW